MSLRLRLFLLLAGLVVLLVGLQAVMVRHLSDRLDRDVRTVAFRVGEEILSGFRFTAVSEEDEAGGKATAPDGSTARTHVMVFAGVEPAPAGGGGPVPSETMKWVVHHEVTRENEGDDATAERREERFELQLDAVAGGAAPGPVEREVRELVLEPGHEPDVLFLRGPARVTRQIQIPRAEVAGTLERFRSELLVGALGIALLGLVAAGFAADRMARPLRALAGAASRVGEGELGLEVAVGRGGGARDELGVAVESFNRMSRRLAELDAENRRLAESERLSELSEVARGLAHTLRNPLNALGLSVDELAARAPRGAGAAELVEASRRQIRRIDGALRSFLALASAGEAAPEPVDLATLVREVALEALQDGGGRVRIEVEAAAPVTLRAVPAEVRAAIQALVVNAVEASPAGGRVRVAVAPRAGGGGRVEVEDEGPGLPAEIAARLFAPHTTTKPHGSGMGLFLAQRIAAGRYGGALALGAAASGSGTRATLELGDRAGGDA